LSDGSESSGSRYADIAQSNLYAHDPKSIVQTGPGLPRWTWSTISLSWSGPVFAAQRLTLWLIPPWANFLLALVRVALLALLLWCLLDLPRELWPKALASMAPVAKQTAAALLAILFFVLATRPA